ncbi:MAG: nitroreductase family protein [Pseudomonadales bacterium]|jgi:nitroreductase
MEFTDVVRTTFAARAFTDEPVTDADLRNLFENARFAPSGGNRQPWRVIVVRERATRDALLPLIRPTMQRYMAQMQAGEAPWNTVNPTRLTAEEIAATPAPEDLLRQVLDAPVLLTVFVDLSYVAAFDADLDRVGVIAGASIYPFVWNLLLCARNAGLGGTLTTFAGAREPEVQALFGVPSHFAFAALLPIGRPVKQLTRLARGPVENFVHMEHWSGPAFPG